MNVRFQETANPLQMATLGAFETFRILAELGRKEMFWFGSALHWGEWAAKAVINL